MKDIVLIQNATEEEIKDFEITEWAEQDLLHYGRKIEWDNWEPKWVCFKAVIEGNIVGSLVSYHMAGVSYIFRLLVAKAHRGKAIGSMLLEELETFAKENKIHKLYLETGKDWDSNEFYGKHGFEVTGELPKHYFGVNFVIYTKVLS